MEGVAYALTKRNVRFVSPDPLAGPCSGAEGRNLLLLAGTARDTVSARTALHARTRAKMARKARSFWLSRDLHSPKSNWTLVR